MTWDIAVGGGIAEVQTRADPESGTNLDGDGGQKGGEIVVGDSEEVFPDQGKGRQDMKLTLGRYPPSRLAENHQVRGLRILTFIKSQEFSQIGTLGIGMELALHQGRLRSSLKGEVRVAARPMTEVNGSGGRQERREPLRRNNRIGEEAVIEPEGDEVIV